MSIKYLNENQIAAFFRVTKNTRDQLVFKLMLTYGLRAGEVTTLRLSDITPDLQHPVEIYITRLKGGISRHYPLSDEIAKLLKKWIRKRDAMLYGHVDSPYIFVSVDPRRPSGQMLFITLAKAHARLAALAGLPKDLRHSHIWRHSCAVQLLSKGADIFFVKSWLGHRSISSTVVYADFMPSGWQRLSQAALSALSF